MKLLVTGGAGFIGSAVVRRAIKDGHGVVNVDALTYAACLDNVAEAAKSPDYTFEHTDCLLYTSPSPRDRTRSRMPSSA